MSTRTLLTNQQRASWNVLCAKGAQFNASLGQRPRIHGPEKAPALKARFTSLDTVVQYVEAQQEHHRTRTFQEEYRELLRRHGVDFDERYVWD